MNALGDSRYRQLYVRNELHQGSQPRVTWLSFNGQMSTMKIIVILLTKQIRPYDFCDVESTNTTAKSGTKMEITV